MWNGALCVCAQSRLCWGVPGSHDSAIAHLQNPIGYAPWVAVGQADAKTPQSRCGAEPHSSKLVVMELVDKEQNGREFLLKKFSHLHEHEQRLTFSMNAMSAPVLCHPVHSHQLFHQRSPCMAGANMSESCANTVSTQPAQTRNGHGMHRHT